MGEHDKTHQTSVLEKAPDKRSGLSVLLAAASLLGVSVGFAGAAAPEPASHTPSDASGANIAGTNPAEHNVQLAAQLPKTEVSAPHVHVNTGTHVNTSNVHPITGVNSSASKLNSDYSKSNANSHFDKTNSSNGNSKFLKLEGIKGESQDDKFKD